MASQRIMEVRDYTRKTFKKINFSLSFQYHFSWKVLKKQFSAAYTKYTPDITQIAEVLLEIMGKIMPKGTPEVCLPFRIIE